MKSWLAQGSSGRRVTLLSGTTFLHINGALVIDMGQQKMGQQKDRTDKTLNPEPSDYITISQPIFYPFINPTIGLSRTVLTTRYCIENKKN